MPHPRAKPSKPAAKSAAKSPAKTSAKKTSAPATHAVFLPTLLPDPFGESSPELCWEWSNGEDRVTLRLTQFGWNASVFGSHGVFHFADGQLASLRDQVIDSSLEPELARALLPPWILAYETAGIPSHP